MEELNDAFGVLNNIARLQLLVRLQTPKTVDELKIPPSKDRGYGLPDGPMSKRAIRKHLEQLKTYDIVREVEDEWPKKYVLDHTRLFALTELMRQVSSVRPVLEPGGGTMTVQKEKPRNTKLEDPHFVVTRGVGEGETIPLDWAGVKTEWVIGRSREADVSLDYDGYVSKEHARIFWDDGAFYLKDLPESRNGTFLNWEQLEEEERVELESGDVVGVGLSLLVFREGASDG